LEIKRNKILGEEEAYRLHSRATWIRCGYNNTRFFHKLASHNRNQKHVWEISDKDGNIITEQGAIKDEAMTYYSHFFKPQTNANINEKVKIASIFPRMVSVEDADSLFNPATLKELKDILPLFKREKSLGLDGWIAEFFTIFFDLVGAELLKVVEDSRMKGNIRGGLNSTFLALIPKKNRPVSFDDFRLISLSNLCYKMISKVIANRIKPTLSRFL